MESKLTHKIKCSKCQIWNNYQHYCSKCKTPISQEKIIEIAFKKDLEKKRNKPKDDLDIFLDNLKNHRFLLVRILYSIIYSISMIISFIVGAIGFIVAFLNG